MQESKSLANSSSGAGGAGEGGSAAVSRGKDDRSEVLQSVSKRLANCEHVGLQKKRILREDEIFDPNDPQIREVGLMRCTRIANQLLIDRSLFARISFV